MAEQFRVLVCPFGKICRKSQNGTRPVDPWHFPSHPCFSFLLLPSLCPQLEPFGKTISLCCGLYFFRQHVSEGFQRRNLFLYLKLRTAVPGPPARTGSLVSLGRCQVTSSARVSLRRSGRLTLEESRGNSVSPRCRMFRDTHGWQGVQASSLLFLEWGLLGHCCPLRLAMVWVSQVLQITCPQEHGCRRQACLPWARWCL